jgi:hypothetical protein
MKPSRIIGLAAVAVLGVSAPVLNAAKNGFDTVQTCTQGNGGHEVDCATTTNVGVVVTTTTGPHGQVKQGKDANTDTTVCGPGNTTGC